MRAVLSVLLLGIVFFAGCKRADVLATEAMEQAFQSRDNRVRKSFDRTIRRDSRNTIQDCLVRNGFMKVTKDRWRNEKVEWTQKAIDSRGFSGHRDGSSSVNVCRREFIEVVDVRNVDIGKQVEVAYTWQNADLAGMASCMYVDERLRSPVCSEDVQTGKVILHYDKETKKWYAAELGI